MDCINIFVPIFFEKSIESVRNGARDQIVDGDIELLAEIFDPGKIELFRRTTGNLATKFSFITRHEVLRRSLCQCHKQPRNLERNQQSYGKNLPPWSIAEFDEEVLVVFRTHSQVAAHKTYAVAKAMMSLENHDRLFLAVLIYVFLLEICPP